MTKNPAPRLKEALALRRQGRHDQAEMLLHGELSFEKYSTVADVAGGFFNAHRACTVDEEARRQNDGAHSFGQRPSSEARRFWRVLWNKVFGVTASN